VRNFGSIIGIAMGAMAIVSSGYLFIHRTTSLWISALSFCAGVYYVAEGIRRILWQQAHSDLARGFEVKLTPGKTPGLIEKKEDDHG
jgi:hypothetical protein